MQQHQPHHKQPPSDATPAVPVRLKHLPTFAGLVIPWVTAKGPDGRYRFGIIDAGRLHRAIHERLCQICGDPLTHPIVVAMRDTDMRPLMLGPEPAMHPECAHYSIRACPMLSGQMTHHRASTPLLDVPGVVHYGDPNGTRPGRPAETWQLVWASAYQPVIDPRTSLAAALILPEHMLRIRAVNPAPTTVD